MAKWNLYDGRASMYDEPPEPTDEEMVAHEQQQAVMRAPTVRIEGITAEAVQFIARDAIERMGLKQRAEEIFEAKLEEAIRDVLKERLGALLDETLRPRIAEIVANGFPVFDQWGSVTGQKPFVQAIHETLHRTTGYNSETLVHKIFHTELQKALKGEFGEALRDAQAQIRRMLDDEVMGRFRKAMKEGLGLKE